ncbi:MAG: type II secretion system protein [Candidatus Latescibacteria bacterium]|nr:type II secretion system protein [Candidatus Latescibacterota bacterium]
MFKKVNRREEKGFTLIELLIVMALLGVLVAVLLPKYQDLTPEAKIAATQQNLESMRSAVLLYAAKYPSPGPPPFLDSLVTRNFLRKIPTLKISGSTTVQSVASMPANPSAATGDWYYCSSTGEVRVGINAVGGAVPINNFLTNYTGPADPWIDW